MAEVPVNIFCGPLKNFSNTTEDFYNISGGPF